ncbi:MAG: hypothetical protein ACOYO1_19730 [Bacteroidales bacterium]
MKRYTAFYQSEIITENMKVISNKCSSISFELLGTSTATIDNVIPLTTDKIREFTEESNIIIEHDFALNFDNADVDKKCLVVRTFYKEV